MGKGPDKQMMDIRDAACREEISSHTDWLTGSLISTELKRSRKIYNPKAGSKADTENLKEDVTKGPARIDLMPRNQENTWIFPRS